MQIPALVVGLGNPGDKYANSRHNIGFEVVDELARLLQSTFSQKFRSHWGEARDKKVYLMKPQTYMNLSGEAVAEAMHFYKWSPEQLLVVSDDLDLPTGQLRLRLFGGSGGHNGLNSIIERLGVDTFPRLRIGIGKAGEASDHVLGKVSKAEKEVLGASIKEAASAIIESLTIGLEKSMNRVNQKREIE